MTQTETTTQFSEILSRAQREAGADLALLGHQFASLVRNEGITLTPEDLEVTLRLIVAQLERGRAFEARVAPIEDNLIKGLAEFGHESASGHTEIKLRYEGKITAVLQELVSEGYALELIFNWWNDLLTTLLDLLNEEQLPEIFFAQLQPTETRAGDFLLDPIKAGNYLANLQENIGVTSPN